MHVAAMSFSRRLELRKLTVKRLISEVSAKGGPDLQLDSSLYAGLVSDEYDAAHAELWTHVTNTARMPLAFTEKVEDAAALVRFIVPWQADAVVRTATASIRMLGLSEAESAARLPCAIILGGLARLNRNLADCAEDVGSLMAEIVPGQWHYPTWRSDEDEGEPLHHRLYQGSLKLVGEVWETEPDEAGRAFRWSCLGSDAGGRALIVEEGKAACEAAFWKHAWETLRASTLGYFSAGIARMPLPEKDG